MKDNQLKDIIILFLAASLMMFATPPFNFFFCAYFSLPVALLVIRRCKKPFLYGFLYGLFYYAMSMYWITYVLTKYGNIQYLISIFLFLLLIAYLSLYYAVFFFFVSRNKSLSIINTLFFSFFWIFLEFIRSNFLTGFPWMLVGYTQYNFLPLIQISSISGIYSVSFIVIFISFSIYYLFIKARFRYLPMLVSIISILILFFWGTQKIKSIKNEVKGKRILNVLLVQGNIDQSQKWEKELQKSIILKHLKLTRENIDPKTDLVVWSETALPIIYGVDKEITEFFRKESENFNIPIISGFVGFKWDDKGNPKLTNSAGVFYKGELIDKYDKVHLVPFGEYVPLQNFLFFVNKLVSAAGDFVPGENIKTCTFNDQSYGIMICYESIFPEISKKLSTNGANVLINITNDAWFGKSPAPYQHFAMSIFRAVENRKYLIRVANTGITAIITPWGEVLSKTEIFEDGVIKGVVFY